MEDPSLASLSIRKVLRDFPPLTNGSMKWKEYVCERIDKH